MRRRKCVLAVLMLVLTCVFMTATAETWYVKTSNGKTVNIRDEKTNKVIGTVPYGTAVEPDDDLSTERSAYVTYKGVTGFVSWKFLVREKPEAYRKGSRSSSADKRTETAETPKVYGEGAYSVSVTGGVLQFQNQKGKATGSQYTEIRFDEPVSLVVTASVPKGKKIDYWLVNGAKLQLSGKSLKLIGEDGNVTVTVVYRDK